MPNMPPSAPLALLACLCAAGLAPAEAAAQPGLSAHGVLESSGGGGATGPSAGGSFGSGGATSGNAASPKAFPDNDSSLHWNIDSEPPAPQGKKGAKPIIAAGS
ncbi:MAG: hypothetical protein ACRC20_11400 [Segniliparus sp.]|uniref:hypothetical protein n=1 Tax=Segniliparus sp. TaxID=2804064 RepID=UPI003F2D652F